MQITCTSCHKQLNLPDEKVPKQPFALTCPGCKSRIQVDPARHEAAAAGQALPAAASPTTEPVGFEPLPTLRESDNELLGELFPAAAVVRLAPVPTEHYEEGLRLLGMDEVRQFTDLSVAAEEMIERELSILVIVLDKATAPPCEPLKPLYEVPLSARRRTFVALAADNVRSLDGQTAFYLQVNCLLNAQERAKFPLYLQRALLFHLRHYRYWGIRTE